MLFLWRVGAEDALMARQFFRTNSRTTRGHCFRSFGNARACPGRMAKGGRQVAEPARGDADVGPPNGGPAPAKSCSGVGRARSEASSRSSSEAAFSMMTRARCHHPRVARWTEEFAGRLRLRVCRLEVRAGISHHISFSTADPRRSGLGDGRAKLRLGRGIAHVSWSPDAR